MHNRRIVLSTCSVNSYAFLFHRLTISIKHRWLSTQCPLKRYGVAIPVPADRCLLTQWTFTSHHVNLIMDPSHPVHYFRLL